MKSLVLVLALTVVGVFASSEHDLARYLRDRYPDPKFVRPVEDHNDVIDVGVAFSLLQIYGLEPTTVTLDLQGMLVMTWSDPFLAWNPEDFGGISKLAYNSSLLWIPNISAWAEHKGLIKPSLSNVRHTGQVTYVMYARYGIRCEPNHDSEINDCELKFGTWNYHSGQLNLGKAPRPGTNQPGDGVATNLLFENPHWFIQSAEADIVEKPWGPNVYQSLKVTLHVAPKTDVE